MYKTPLFDALKNYNSMGYSPFFMPGHKLGKGIPSAFHLDITEIEETDNLHIPESVIKESQELLALTFGAKHSFFLVNGSTSGIQSMFMSVLKPNDKVIVARDCHISCISSLILTGANPIFISPEYINEAGIYGCINPKSIEKCIQENPDSVSIYITSPNYYGFCADIKAIADIVHKYNKLLLVDEAHGGHFVFSDMLPKTAVSQGADLCVQSAHKTLPALTQSAYLHSNGTILKEKIQSALNILLTSSPSYILMAYLDLARAYMEEQGEILFNNIIQSCADVKELNLDFADKYKGYYSIKDIDKSRITLLGDFSAVNFRKYSIVPEMATEVCSVFLPSAGTNKEDFIRLKNALKNIKIKNSKKFETPGFSKITVLPRESYFAPTEAITLSNSIGRICATTIAPYPPGIPILIPGEVITEDIINYLSRNQTSFWGLEKEILVIK